MLLAHERDVEGFLALVTVATRRPERLLLTRAFGGGRVPSPGAASVLQRLLLDPDPEVRLSALVGLGKIAATEATQSVVAVLEDPEPAVRAAAVATLVILDPQGLPDLARRIAEDPAVGVRTALLDALGTHGGPQPTPVLESLLNDPHAPVRRAALLLLLAGGEDALTRFAGRLSRLDAAESLSLREQAGPELPRIVSLIRTSMREEVRMAGIAVLDWFGGAQVEAVHHSLADPSPTVRLAAVRVFARHKPPGIAERLAPLTRDPDVDVRTTAMAALVAVTQPERIEVRRPGPIAEG